MDQQNSHIVVMVTGLVERGTVKCEKYWPDRPGDSFSFPASEFGPPVKITLETQREFKGWITRELTLNGKPTVQCKLQHTNARSSIAYMHS